MTDLAPATRLGPYVLEERLGRGGMATVYRALDTKLQRRVALKFLHADAALSPSVRHRFLREAQAAARLKHPHLVEVYGTDEIDGRMFLVMEYIQGAPLGRRSPDVREGATLVRKIAEAIDHAHRHGVVHRDLKPANVIIDAAGEPHVVDFGLAHLSDAQSRLTRTGSQLGTPLYMAPEQVAGQPEQIDARTDVYGLGAILYEVLSGRPVFAADSLAAIYSKIQHEDPTPPSKWRPGLPPDLETICLKALAKEPGRRYARAADLAEDLRRWLEGEPIRARRTSVAYWARKKLTKHRWAALAAVLVGLAAGGFVLGTRISQQRQKSAWVREGEAAERDGQWEKALGAYERAGALDPLDAGLRERKERLARRVREERDRLQKERDRAEALEGATQVYEGAKRELHALRLRSYRADWRFTDPEFDRFRGLMDQCRVQMRKTGECGEGWWVIGRTAQVLGDWKSALEAYQSGLRAQPGHAACTLSRARLLVERAVLDRLTGKNSTWERNMKEGLSLLEAGMAAGQVEPIELDLAKGYLLVLKIQPAREYCRQMLEKWKGADFREEFHVVHGLAHPSELIDAVSEALKLRPAFHEGYFWRGGARSVRGDFPGAVGDFTRAIEIHPRYAEAYMNRGIALKSSGDFDGAIADFTKVVELEPRNPDAYGNRGIARRAKGDLEGAIRDYTQALEVDPRFAPAHFNRGLARRAQGDVPGAIDDYTRAIDIDPAFAEPYVNRGAERHQMGDPKGAIDDYSKAIELSPTMAVAWLNRGLAREDSGALAEAAKDFEKALELGGAAWAHRTLAKNALERVRAKMGKE